MSAEEFTIEESAGERMVYLVPSRSRPGRKYRVDLLANDGAGQCLCKDFVTRRQPALDRGEEILQPSTTCRHSRAALRYFIVRLLQTMAAKTEKQS